MEQAQRESHAQRSGDVNTLHNDGNPGLIVPQLPSSDVIQGLQNNAFALYTRLGEQRQLYPTIAGGTYRQARSRFEETIRMAQESGDADFMFLTNRLCGLYQEEVNTLDAVVITLMNFQTAYVQQVNADHSENSNAHTQLRDLLKVIICFQIFDHLMSSRIEQSKRRYDELGDQCHAALERQRGESPQDQLRDLIPYAHIIRETVQFNNAPFHRTLNADLSRGGLPSFDIFDDEIIENLGQCLNHFPVSRLLDWYARS